MAWNTKTTAEEDAAQVYTVGQQTLAQTACRPHPTANHHLEGGIRNVLVAVPTGCFPINVQAIYLVISYQVVYVFILNALPSLICTDYSIHS